MEISFLNKCRTFGNKCSHIKNCDTSNKNAQGHKKYLNMVLIWSDHKKVRNKNIGSLRHVWSPAKTEEHLFTHFITGYTRTIFGTFRWKIQAFDSLCERVRQTSWWYLKKINLLTLIVFINFAYSCNFMRNTSHGPVKNHFACYLTEAKIIIIFNTYIRIYRVAQKKPDDFDGS